MTTLHLGDCLEFMATLPSGSIDAIITDPPYGTTNLEFDRASIDWAAFWAEARRVTKPAAVTVMFADGLFTVDLIQSARDLYRYRLVWQKTMATGFLDANRRPLRAHEDVLVFCRRLRDSTYNAQKTPGDPYRSRRTDDTAAHYGQGRLPSIGNETGDRHPVSVLSYPNGNGNRGLHPTQKPVDLMRFLVSSYTNPGDIVFDPFSGSGSTGVACVQLRREFIGCELNPEYHAIATQRLAATHPDGVTVNLPAPSDSLFGGTQ